MFRKKAARLISDNLGLFPSLAAAYNLSDDPVTWTEQVRFLGGKPFSFKDREYLKDIYRDTCQRMFIVKPRQMEITEFALNWLLYNLDRNPFTVGLYMSDRQDHVSIFSKLRLHSWGIEQSDYLKSKAVKMKEGNIGWQPFTNGAHLWMFSGWGDFEAARSIPVDFAVVDEVQSMNVEALPVLEESMSKSRFKRLRVIGTGSDYEDGWFKKWHTGDQRKWNKESNTWIAGKTENESYAHSYHITQEMASWITPEEIEVKRQKYTPRRFQNEVYGWWHKGARKPLLEAEMRFLFDRTLHLLTPEDVNYTLGDLYMGVDWGGGTKAYTIPWIWQCLDNDIPRFRLVYISKIEERSTEKQAEMIANLIDAYHLKQGVMDAGGGTYQVQRLEEMYPNHMMKCNYTQRPQDPFESIDAENRIVVDRTWVIESIIDLITRPQSDMLHPQGVPRIFIPAADLEKVEWIIDHFTCIEGVTTTMGSGATYVKYEHPEELPDDALHACNYAYLAWLYGKTNKWHWISA